MLTTITQIAVHFLRGISLIKEIETDKFIYYILIIYIIYEYLRKYNYI